MAPTPPQPRATTVRTVAPKLIDLTEKVVFGDVWERPGLSKRDRSLITVATLVALNRTEQLVGHLDRALDNGVTKDEIGELITHLAFYAGWPCAMSAALIAKDVFEKKKLRSASWRRICKLDSSVWALMGATWPPTSRPQATSSSVHDVRPARRTGIRRPARAGPTSPAGCRRGSAMSSSPRCPDRPRWKPWRSAKTACCEGMKKGSGFLRSLHQLTDRWCASCTASSPRRACICSMRPVSGGPEGARSGRLAIWVGGDRESTTSTSRVLDAIGDQARYIGADRRRRASPSSCTTARATPCRRRWPRSSPWASRAASIHRRSGKRCAGRAGPTPDVRSASAEQFLVNKYEPPAFALKLAHKDMTLGDAARPRAGRAHAARQYGAWPR